MKHNKTQVRLIGFATGAAVMGDALLYIVLPLYWEDFGLTSLWQIGVLLGANRLIRLPVNPVVGYFYGKFPYKLGFVIALVLSLITTLSYSVFSGFWFLLIVRIFWGIAWSFLRLGGVLLVLSIARDNNRGELLGIYNGTWGLGALFGMLAGGWLIPWINVEWIYISFGLIIIFISLLVLKSWDIQEVREEAPTNIENSKAKFRFNRRVIHQLFSAWSIGFVFFGVIGSILPNIINDHVGSMVLVLELSISAAAFASLLQALRWGWEPIFNPLYGRWTDHRGNRSSLFPLLLLAASILLGFVTFSSGIATIILLLILQFFSSMIVTSSDTLASDLGSKTNQVKTMTLYTMSIDLGAACGPLLAFTLYDFGSLSLAIYFTCLVLLSNTLSWFYQNKKRAHEAFSK